MNWSWKISITVILAVIGACLISKLSSPQLQEPAIKPFSVWQEHVQPAKLPLRFKPAISEKIYVPLYSHIYQDDNVRTALLAGTLSIRNTDSETGLILKSVAYFNTQGKLLQELCKEPVVLRPMATAEIVVPLNNSDGGSGANFTVEWMAAKPVSEPIVESVMISNGSARDISFVSRGVVVSKTIAGSATAAAQRGNLNE